ncbi:GNAT family N-acetyltransferase [Ureibacillus aquaedulcis]|uniref:GNAT family N-acetyltransferase n=1 Tax=Ureibacillus aquaedulcis TaxID=3058421 RepID=A0ABT8GKM4_9BACL|nr:GNAT family N-acetyltransferase [Ureibacillus sp. BA0131]MDN4491963.1 GNAT family N-acetyltransferase [Ureibacillus sp. BA0131]
MAKDLNELSLFLAELNTGKSCHIGYCGDKVEEIYETLKEDFVKENGQLSFHVARNADGKIDAAIGLDIDDDSAEVWGPFNKTSSQDLQQQLWEQLLEQYPNIETFNFFLNSENLKQQEFMKISQASKSGEYLVLVVKKEQFEAVQELKSTQFIESDFRAFEILHETVFPETYYNAKTIVDRLNDKCILKVLKSEKGEMLGYAYFEVDLAMEEAALHYFAISPTAQNKGYGTMLLKEVITEIFNFTPIMEIKLCVERENTQANHVYFKVGFKEKDVLFSYRLTRNDGGK